MTDTKSPIFQFDDVRVDPRSFKTWKAGSEVPMEPKTFSVLLFLIENRGRLIEKKELLDSVWKDTFVTENAMTREVAKLRKALGDDSRESKYIQTVHTRGYRFIAEVTEENIHPKLAAATHSIRENRRYDKRIVGAFAFAILLAGAATLSVWLAGWLRPNRAIPFARVQITKVPMARNVLFGNISPDGKYIAYVAGEFDGDKSLWVKQVATDSNVQIVPPAKVSYGGLKFSPDSNFFYYTSADEVTQLPGAVYKVPVLGGPPRRLPVSLSTISSFSLHDKRMLGRRYDPRSQSGFLVIANADGGDEGTLLKLNSVGHCFYSAWSPDGKRIACLNRASDELGDMWHVSEIPLAGGPEKRIGAAPHRHPMSGLAWLPDGRGLLLLAEEEASRVSQVWYMSYPDGEMRRITQDLTNYTRISVTADGSQILVNGRDRPSNIWVAPAANLGAARQVTTGAAEYSQVSWAPDGRLIHVLIRDIWMMNTDGGERRQLTADASRNLDPVFTPDGRSIVFNSIRSGRSSVWRMDADGGNPVQLTPEGGTMPSCSHDGRWVFYTLFSGRERRSIWRVPLEGGTPVQVLPPNTSKAAVSPDGKLLVYEFVDQDKRQSLMAVVSAEGGPPIKVFEASTIFGMIVWARDGSGINYVNGRTGVLEFQPLAGGPRRTLVHPKGESIFSFDISRDGKQLVYTKGVVTSSLVLISDLKDGG